MTRERFPLRNDSILWLIPLYEAGDADYRALNILEAGDVSRIRLYLENPLRLRAFHSLYRTGIPVPDTARSAGAARTE